MISVLLLLLFVGGVTIGALRILSAGRAAKITEPACGHCGYCVRGVPSLTCPECGSDLREVGILTPSTTGRIAYRLPYPAKALIWTALYIIPAIIIFQIATALGPKVATGTLHRAVFVTTDPSRTIAGGYELDMTGEQTLWTGSPYMNAIPLTQLTIKRSGVLATALHIDLTAHSFQYTDRAGKSVTGPYDRAAFRRWLTDTASADLTDPDLSTTADALYEVIAATPTTARFASPIGNFVYTGPRDSHGQTPIVAHPESTAVFGRPHPISNLIGIISTLIFWLAGLFLLRRFHRRSTSRSTASATASPSFVASP